MLQFDLSEFERKAKALGGAIDQVPFALAGALNDAAKAARQHLIDETWPKSVTVRNRTFMRAALRTEFASKTNLTVALVDTLGRGHLKLHASGGLKQAKGRLAIPTKRVRRGRGGVVASQRPANLKGAVVKNNLIFVRTGKGKKSRLELMYKLRPAAQIKKDVPFVDDFRRVMLREVSASFPQRLARAMATRR